MKTLEPTATATKWYCQHTGTQRFLASDSSGKLWLTSDKRKALSFDTQMELLDEVSDLLHNEPSFPEGCYVHVQA